MQQTPSHYQEPNRASLRFDKRASRLMIALATSLFFLAVLQPASADLVTYTSQSDFLAALPGSGQFSGTDFDSLTAPFTIATGQSVDGITFNYDFGGVEMQVSDAFPTTSGQNFLGTTDADVFLGGDDFNLGFDAQNAIGMNFISADALLDNDIQLTFGGATASLLSTAVEGNLSDGSFVYFLGIIDTVNTFGTADISSILDVIIFNVDDIQLASIPVPEPTTFTMFGIGVALILYTRRR